MYLLHVYYHTILILIAYVQKQRRPTPMPPAELEVWWSDSSFTSTLCLHNCTRCLELSFLDNAISTPIANWNCLGQFHKIPWNQTTYVHRGSTLITLVITWRWHNITWRWRHRNHVNTITSVIETKQAAKNEVYAFSIKYGYSDILYWKIHKHYLFCWLKFMGNQSNRF